MNVQGAILPQEPVEYGVTAENVPLAPNPQQVARSTDYNSFGVQRAVLGSPTQLVTLMDLGVRWTRRDASCIPEPTKKIAAATNQGPDNIKNDENAIQ